MTLSNIQQHVQRVARRMQLVRRRTAIAQAGLITAGFGLAGYLLATWQPVLAAPLQVAFVLTAAVLFIRVFSARRPQPSDQLLAVREIETRFPELEARLLTAIEQQPDVWTGRFNLFQMRLLEEVGQHARTHDWPGVVSPSVLTRGWMRQSAALAALLVAAIGIGTLSSPLSGTASPNRKWASGPNGVNPDFTVDPGDAQVERNQSLLVLLRFQSEPPRDVTLIWQPARGAAQRLTMTRSLDDPVFAGRLATIAADGIYRLEFGATTTREYAVSVYDLPSLVHSSLTVVAPSYTRREPQVFASASVVTVIEGSQIRLNAYVNKPLAQVELHDEQDGKTIPLAISPDNPLQYLAEWQPDKSRRWRLVLKDAEGRANRDPQEFQVDVVANRRPELKPVFPGQDLRVSPLQEISLEMRASDDFGILASGIVIDPAGGDLITVPLTKELAGGEAHALVHELALEELKLEPGNVVSYAFYADDHGSDGQPRRTMSDLFFLELRPYEESFRQMEGAGGQSGPQGSSGSPGQNLDKLIELQKQIVTATWNLQRRDPDLKQAAEQTVVETLQESQAHAKEDFEKLTEALEGAVPVERIRTIVEHMTRAIESFTAVWTLQEAEELQTAVQATRGAFQGLIKLKPNDHRIMQGGQSGGGAGGGGSMSQQQLQQLELDGEANRYEREKSARQQADAAPQKEQLATLNRLKELAHRQQGVNEKLKELDAERRSARTAAQQAELERQLKQLRDEQQDLLQDADSLRNRMEQSSQSEKTADARRQLEQTRKQLVDAAESLKENKLGQALSSGTRAERDLQKLQVDFRKQTSAQLAEAMQQLRNQARDLAETEDAAAKELARLGDPADKSLRQRQAREKLAETFQEQKEKLNEALKSLREIVQAAEASEPLAAKRLYDTARQVQQQKTEQALNAASQLVKQGFVPEATQVEQLAQTGIKALREGIEEAAESVLGDELTDLKRAKRELAELSKELQEEMSAARGEGKPGEGKEGETGDGQPGSGQPSDKPSDKSDPNGKSPGQGKTPGKGESSEEGQSPGEGKSPDGKGGEGQSGNSPEGTSESGQGSSPSDSQNEKPSPGNGKGGLRGGKARKPSGSQQPGLGQKQPGQSDSGQSGGPGGQGGPLTGGNYTDWADRLRDVETLLSDPELQAEVSKVREQARNMRAEFKRHSKTPNWDLVEEDVRQPLVELQQRLAEEIARRESPDALVPTDRDPVPERYRELVRQYYERLGGGGK